MIVPPVEVLDASLTPATGVVIGGCASLAGDPNRVAQIGVVDVFVDGAAV
jgi:hypothetical protein